MHWKKIINEGFRFIAPFFLGGAILYWMYCGFNFHSVEKGFERLNWFWMLLSFPFGIMAQVFRGLRWEQLLNPMNEYPRKRDCINAVFLSYGSSLIIPRIGEIMRCGILKKYDAVSFPKSLGTVVTERVIDSLLVLLIMGITILMQMPVFFRFFSTTGTDITQIFSRFTKEGYWVLFSCILAVGFLLFFIVRRLSIFGKVKVIVKNMMEGIFSLKKVKNIPLFLFYTLAIWGCYFLHFYLTFFCYDFTSHLSSMAALVVFIVGSIAVIVPTPNGAGPWHFAVKTMLVFYGVGATDAAVFALVVHTIQTVLVAILGIYALVALSFSNRKYVIKTKNTNEFN